MMTSDLLVVFGMFSIGIPFISTFAMKTPKTRRSSAVHTTVYLFGLGLMVAASYTEGYRDPYWFRYIFIVLAALMVVMSILNDRAMAALERAKADKSQKGATV